MISCQGMSVPEQIEVGRVAGPNQAQFVVKRICPIGPELQIPAAEYLKDCEMVVWVDLSTRRMLRCGHIGYIVPLDITNEVRAKAGLYPFRNPACVCEEMGHLIE